MTAMFDTRRLVIASQEPGFAFAQGFPVGNGRIGVMCFGGPARLVFIINHFDLYWRVQARPRARRGFWKRVRLLFRQRRWQELHKLTANAFAGWGRTELGAFQPAAILEVWPELPDGATDYVRTLDYQRRVVGMSCRISGRPFTLEAYAPGTQPAAVIRIRYAAPGGGVAKVRLYRPGDSRFTEPVTAATPSQLRLRHGWREEATTYDVAVRLVGGRMDRPSLSNAPFEPPSFGGHVPTVDHPDAALHAEARGIACWKRTLELRIAVDVRHGGKTPAVAAIPRTGVPAPDRQCAAALARADLELSGGSPNDPAAPAHYQRLFQLGRYLFTAATFPGGWPPNLQGIWNDRAHPVCNSDWHLDLNAQMALWHVPAGNLLEYHEPFFKLVEALLAGARDNARCIFNMRGAAFAVCTVGNGHGLAYLDSWVGTSGWILDHFHTHWRYTRDRRFLRQRYFPILRDVCRFYLDYLQEENGRLVIYPSQSPENRLLPRANSFHGKNSTFDLSIFRAVLEQTVEAAGELRVADELTDEAARALPRLASFPLAPDGRLREMEDFEFDRGHRHLSHLYPVFPAGQITDADPIAMRAARLALRAFRRWPSTGQAQWFARVGYGAWAGWTYPLLACTYARLGDGDEALALLRRFSTAFRWPSGLARCFEEHDLGYGIHASPDIGKWIEIDSTLGSVAAIQEMLLQSHGGVLRLLPALPRSWRQGSFRGLRAEGGFEVDAQWNRGRLKRAAIRSLLGQLCEIKFPAGADYHIRESGRSVDLVWDKHTRTATFKTRPDKQYEVTPPR